GRDHRAERARRVLPQPAERADEALPQPDPAQLGGAVWPRLRPCVTALLSPSPSGSSRGSIPPPARRQPWMLGTSPSMTGGRQGDVAVGATAGWGVRQGDGRRRNGRVADAPTFFPVTLGLVPRGHPSASASAAMDARDKPEHDGWVRQGDVAVAA